VAMAVAVGSFHALTDECGTSAIAVSPAKIEQLGPQVSDTDCDQTLGVPDSSHETPWQGPVARLAEQTSQSVTCVSSSKSGFAMVFGTTPGEPRQPKVRHGARVASRICSDHSFQILFCRWLI